MRNYRLYFLGALISNIGTWMFRVAQDWLVLTDLTDQSSTALGVVTGLQFIAIPLLAPWAGAAVDRFGKRQLLLLTQILQGLNAVVFFVLVAGGWVQLWHVYLLATTLGAVAAFDGPARQAFVSEMVPENLLTNAVGLNSTSFNAARLVGPASAGLIIAAWGVAPCMVINALTFVAMIAALLLMRPGELHPAPRRRGSGSVREGLSYIRHRPDIMMLMLVVFMLGTFGMNFQLTNATMATMVFGKGAQEFGLLGTMIAIGTMSGALGTARRNRARMRTLVGALVGFTVAATALALAPSYTLYSLLLIPVGYCMITVATTANSTVQLSTEPQMRGRVMAVYLAIFQGGTPLGSPLVGWVGDVLSPRWSILIGAIATGLTLIVLLVWYHSQDVHFRFTRGWPPQLRVWTEDEDLIGDPGELR